MAMMRMMLAGAAAQKGCISSHIKNSQEVQHERPCETSVFGLTCTKKRASVPHSRGPPPRPQVGSIALFRTIAYAPFGASG